MILQDSSQLNSRKINNIQRFLYFKDIFSIKSLSKEKSIINNLPPGFKRWFFNTVLNSTQLQKDQQPSTILIIQRFFFQLRVYQKKNQSSTTFHRVSKGDSSTQFSQRQPVLVHHLGTFPFHISWFKDAKSTMIACLKKFLKSSWNSAIVRFHCLPKKIITFFSSSR